jgi:stearoyl-CoA desaturase (delta-9 desaturase)
MKESLLTQPPVLFLGLVALGFLIAGMIPIEYLWLSFFGWVLISGLGISVGYHRVFSHRTHQLSTWKENILLFLGVFAGQGPSIFWVAAHRGHHHRHADTDKDLHSPKIHGVAKTLLWHYDLPSWFSLRGATELFRKSNHMWFFNHYRKILFGVPFLVLLWDWQVAMMLFWLPGLIANVQDNMVNVVGHLKLGMGYRNFETNDNSYNQPIIAFFTWGQAWHNNHHADPGNYNFGKKWWEFDPTLLFLPLLK